MPKKKKKEYTNFANVEVMQNYNIPEEFPEGPFGSPIKRAIEPEPDARSYSAFNYENKTLHQDIPRQFPGAHPTHDDPTQDLEKPYEDVNQKS